MTHASSTSGGAAPASSLAMPRFGSISIGWLLLLALVIVLATPDPELLVGSLSGRIGQGVMWGTASVIAWVLATPPATLGRRSLAIFFLGLLIWWFHLSSGRPVSRYVISIGSFALLQLATATILGWPGWSFGTQSLHVQYRYRFGIGGLMLLTAAIAVIFAATRSYEPTEGLFHGSRVAAVGLVMVALAGQRAMVSRRHAALWATVTLVGTGLTVILLGSLHALQLRMVAYSNPAANFQSSHTTWWLYYSPVVFTFAIVVTGTAACGRLDHEIEKARRQRHDRLSQSPEQTEAMDASRGDA